MNQILFKLAILNSKLLFEIGHVITFVIRVEYSITDLIKSSFSSCCLLLTLKIKS